MLFKGCLSNGIRFYYLKILLICSVLFVRGYKFEDAQNENSTKIQSDTQKIGVQDKFKSAMNATGETTGFKARQKCIEYSQFIYELINPDNDRDSERTIKIDNCAHKPSAIYLGSQIIKGEFPHMALLIYINDKNEEEWQCAGILISEEYVLTAAHCTTSKRTGAVRRVRLGVQSIELDMAEESVIQDFEVKEIFRHPGFDNYHVYNDIALLKLDRKATLNKYVMPACLHVGYEIKEKIINLAAWEPYATETTKPGLTKKHLEIFANDECNQIYNSTHSNKLNFGIEDDTMLCVGHRTETRSSCHGYSGAPIQVYLRDPYCMYDVIGVGSFGRSCYVHGAPVVSTRVSAYISWIESIVWPD